MIYGYLWNMPGIACEGLTYAKRCLSYFYDPCRAIELQSLIDAGHQFSNSIDSYTHNSHYIGSRKSCPASFGEHANLPLRIEGEG